VSVFLRPFLPRDACHLASSLVRICYLRRFASSPPVCAICGRGRKRSGKHFLRVLLVSFDSAGGARAATPCASASTGPWRGGPGVVNQQDATPQQLPQLIAVTDAIQIADIRSYTLESVPFIQQPSRGEHVADTLPLFISVDLRMNAGVVLIVGHAC
jgi:hypothetical protein